MTVETNLKILKRTRRKPEVGDIFVFQLAELLDRFFFGRVVSTSARIGGMPNDVILIYLYKTWSFQKSPIPELKLSNLLLPPLGTNALPWTKGYFEVVDSWKISQDDLLPQHCFRDFRGWCVDELGNRLNEEYEPVGVNALHSYRTIDDEVSKVLGIGSVLQAK